MRSTHRRLALVTFVAALITGSAASSAVPDPGGTAPPAAPPPSSSTPSTPSTPADSDASPAPLARPQLLPRRMRMRDAVAQLGSAVDGAARGRGSTGAEWARLAADDSAWLDQRGDLLYVDQVAPTTATAAAPVVAAAPFPYAQTFALHSNPTATRKLYLDFDGHTVTGSAWSSGTLVAAPYSTDSSTAFSNAELDVIQTAWQWVAEDYAPFDIDVTTEDPGPAGINRSSTSDTAFGTRVVITGAGGVYSTVCPGGCGGVAYVGTVDLTGSTHDFYQPAWVFNGDVRGIAEAVSHEAGHNLGLNHDGTATLGYYEGHAMWAPIMGVGYYQPVTQWSKGEYSGASNTQDDFAVAAANAIPLRADDYGDLAAPAAVANPVSLSGVISSASDVDAFRFTTAGGVVTLTANGASVGGNLDIQLSLVDAAGAVVASSDPTVTRVSSSAASGLGSSLTANVAAGTYRVAVEGVGFATPATGYSDYGSLGAYSLTGSFTPTAGNQPPSAIAGASVGSGTAPLTVTFSSAGSTDVDGTIVSYSWAFSDGTNASGASVSKTFTTAANYTATLTVTDDGGATASSVATVVVSPPTTGDQVLTSGVAVTPLSDAANGAKYFMVSVPSGTERLVVATRNGSGDVDLYVRRGSRPTTSSYGCRSTVGGNTDTCTFNSPSSGDYFILLSGYTAYDGAQLVASVVSSTSLVNGTVVSGLAAPRGAQVGYKISVPSGRRSLTVQISGGSGDADMYLKRSSLPTMSSYTCRPFTSGNAETCTVSNPSSGTWYIMLNADDAYSGVTLKATFT